VIKVCAACNSTWAGGLWCEDCGAELRDPYAPDAGATLPRSIWRYIRLQYGARRGMLVRVMAFLLGPVVFGLGAREAVTWPSPWNVVGLSAAALAGLACWWTIYWLAGKAVRVWVLQKGRLNKRRAARALLRSARDTLSLPRR
jgi:hypothetical protein